MQLTKQQKIVGAVLALAALALVTDRWVIGSDDSAALVAPETATAQQAGAKRRSMAQPARPAVAAAPGEAEAGSVAALAARLEGARTTIAAKDPRFDLEKIHDAFQPTASLAGARQKVEAPAEQQDAAKAFTDKHKLAAVVKRQSGRGVAIFQDKFTLPGQTKPAQATLAVGQSLDGFVLVAVKDRSAILRRGAQRIEMRLSEDTAQATITASPTSEKVAAIDAGK